MTVSNMKPVQIYLRPEQIVALRALAKRREISVAELVRQGVDQLLAGVPAEEDSAWNIIGLCDSGPTDLSANHDEYLAQIFKAERGR